MRIKFTKSQIVAILKEGVAGIPVAEVCRKHGDVGAIMGSDGTCQ